MSGRAAIRRALEATRSRWRLAALGVLLGTGALLASGALLAVSGYLISRAAQQPEILLLTMAIVGVRFFGISRAILRYLERLVTHDLAFRSLTDLRVRFFKNLVPLVPGGLRDSRPADLLSRFIADADRMQDLYLRAVVPPAVALLAGGAAVAVAAVMLPAAGLVIAVILLLAGIGVPLLARLAARRAGRHQAEARSALAADMVEIVSGAPEIALAGREDDWVERASASSRRLARVLTGDAIAGGLVAGAAATLAAGAVVATAAVAIPAVDDGRLAGVLLAALVLLAFASIEAVAPLGGAAVNADAVAGAAARLEEVSELPAPIRPARFPRPVPAGGALAIEGVSFAHAGSPPLFEDAELILEPGGAVALCGPSGGGKSTLAELLVRFRDPTSGRITLGGVDIRDADSDEVRRAVRIAPQDAYLFSTTIFENVRLANPGSSVPAVLHALELVGLGPWIRSLPEGARTQVGEQGGRVSGGQRQRIAAARLFLADARFLVFDEPTTHLDAEGAREMVDQLVSLSRRHRRGVLVITHDRTQLHRFDRAYELRSRSLASLRTA